MCQCVHCQMADVEVRETKIIILVGKMCPLVEKNKLFIWNCCLAA